MYVIQTQRRGLGGGKAPHQCITLYGMKSAGGATAELYHVLEMIYEDVVLWGRVC